MKNKKKTVAIITVILLSMECSGSAISITTAIKNNYAAICKDI